MGAGSIRAVPFDRSLAALVPGAVAIWDTVNNCAASSEVGVKSNVKAHWVCPTDPDHRYLKRVFEVTALLDAGHEPCPYCNGRELLAKDSLAVRHPDVATDWDYTRNGIGPDAVRHDSGRRRAWVCSTPVRGAKDHVRRAGGYG